MAGIFSNRSTVLAVCLLSLLLFALPLAAQGNFAISATPSSLSIPQSGQGTATITTTISGGFNDSIGLSASGAPPGVSVNFNPSTIAAPGAGSSTMTITVIPIARPGTYVITVAGTSGGGIRQATTVSLTVTPMGPPNFSMSATPAALTIGQGNQGTSGIYTVINGGFNNSISLSASGVPLGIVVAFSPQTIPAPGDGSSTMTITVLRLTMPGTYPITVTGSGGGTKQSTTVMVTVPSPQDFAISLAPASLIIVQGNQGTSTITTTINGGFNASISLSASGLPDSTTVSFNPQTIPAPGSGNSTMTITVGTNTNVGTYPITIIGSGGGIQRYATLTLTVITGSAFVMGSSPSSLSISEGGLAISAISSVVCCGFNNSVSLSASGVPPGVSVTLNPATLPAPGSGTAKMIMKVANNVPTGSYPITVTGNGGGDLQSTTVTLTVTGGQPPRNANFMEAYSYTLRSSFGTPPYTYQITSGALPAGLTMDSSGAIAGTATVVGAFPFQVLATDSSHPAQKQSSSYILNVVIGLDQYSGLTAAPVPGCNQTGYFQALTVKQKDGSRRWVYADPICNAFYQLAVYQADSEFIFSGIFQSKYGNDSAKFAKHSLQREVAYGFNSNDIFYSDYMLPIPKGGATGAMPQLPFLLYFGTTDDAIHHYSWVGIPEPIKDMCIGQDSYGFGDFCNYTLDILDPNWLVANQGELALLLNPAIGGFPNGFNTTPWAVALSLGDADLLYMFKGNGSGQNDVPVYPHPAMVVATSAFNYNLPPVNGNWQRPILYAKAAWACNAVANDPINLPPGQSYLEKKYGNNIAALNQAWGTGNFYTSFCDDGGFGTGTGVLDEDGQHTAWFGSDYYNQTAMNPNLKADLDGYLYTMAYQVYSPQVSVARSYDTNHLLMCGFYGGTGDGGMRTIVAQAFRDAGCQIIVLNWNSYYPSQGQASSQAVYDLIGLPATIFYYVTSQADSDYSNFPDNGAFDADYPTQQSRGQHYGSDTQVMLGTRGSNGDYFTMGVDFWSLTDNINLHTNYGFISSSDNVYDGVCATRAVSVDPWGYPCGGEEADYGDFTDGVNQANSALLQQLIRTLLQ